ncbi:1-deoxy-D-xylulose-5-phosphate reductoisomerase [Aeromicrobium duanguangcaii]|uniref:1-deoxy-D-xylulose 5-phosphate reductoisomerase n=1 Tax=Aeromicrobium duanguangcaii TaxID=2968086 RepID=A0ABY5KAL5_9ACTN|nr:1-deoxy-D-xylulose-5-phosphate reductoisomerase [Aeromicrobium duanguangcaii]UUI67487.1 1-deoxy-D-xylulose-5-phosphate reductoisomerase [Aeromicrobium duanguangcaii]
MSSRVVVLGSTGSIGTQALDVVRAHPDRFDVVAIAAGGADPSTLASQALEFDVEVVAVANATAAQDVQLALYAQAQRRGWSAGEYRLPRLLAGPDAAVEAARIPADTVLNGMTGAVGLLPTLAALESGATLALANKESLIMGGSLVLDAAKPGQLVPVDSEHSALAQALRGEEIDDVRRLVLTASGGPFRGRTREDLRDVTPEQAAAHPTWDMGPVITINSATLVNKGLEVIEAHLLFGIEYERIDVVVHPTSVVHSMVEFVDGSTMAQASPPDMKLPIALGLSWPRRVPGAVAPCDWTSATAWEFFPLDEDAFPAIRVARRAGAFGRTAPAVFNAANEVCVDAFVAGDLDFLGIVDTVAEIVDEHLADPDWGTGDLTVARVLEADMVARERARAVVAARSEVSSR